MRTTVTSTITVCLVALIAEIDGNVTERGDLSLGTPNQMQTLDKHNAKVIRYSRKSISSPLTSRELLQKTQQEVSKSTFTAQLMSRMSDILIAHKAKLAFFHETTARFSDNSQKRKSFTTATILQIQTKRTDSVRTIPKKHGSKKRLDSSSQCKSSTVFDLVELERNLVQRCIGLVSQVQNFLKQKRNRETLRWWRMKPSTLHAQLLMS